MKIYALICHKLDLTQFWPKVVSWRFEITTDELALKLGGWLSEAIDLKCLCTLSYLPPPNTIISRPNRPIFVSKGMPGCRQYGDELFIKKMFIQFLCFCFDLLFCSAHQILHRVSYRIVSFHYLAPAVIYLSGNFQI